MMIVLEGPAYSVVVRRGPSIGNRPTIWFSLDVIDGSCTTIRLWPEEARKVAAALMALAPEPRAPDPK
jgi:hypothetical protein